MSLASGGADGPVKLWLTTRRPEVEGLLRASGVGLTHLGLSKDGHPKHPLYIGYAVQPVDWPASD